MIRIVQVNSAFPYVQSEQIEEVKFMMLLIVVNFINQSIGRMSQMIVKINGFESCYDCDYA